MPIDPDKPSKNGRHRSMSDMPPNDVAAPKFLKDIVHGLAYIPGNVLVADARGVILYANPRTLSALGYAPADMIGKEIASFWDQSEDASEHIMDQLKRDLAWQGKIKHHLKSDGDNRTGKNGWELVSLSIVQGADDGSTYIIKIGLPIESEKEDSPEARPAQSEKDLQALMDSTPYIIIIYRLSDRTCLDVNRSFCLRTGYTRQEVLGRTPKELGLFKDLADEEKLVRAFERDGRVDDMRIPFASKSGEIIDAVISARRIEFRGESCVLTSSMEVIDLSKAQRALQESELLYRTLMEATPENIVLSRLRDGKIVHVNSAFYKRSGWGPEECLGRTTLELNIYVNPEDRDKFVALLRRDGQVTGFQVPVHFKDGVLSYEMWSARVVDLYGEKHIVVVTRDISELIATRNALEESERNYRTILETSPHPVSVFRRSDSRYVLVNEAFARNTGYSRQEVVGTLSKDLNLLENPTDGERFIQTFKLEGHVDGMELRLLRKDGRVTENLISARTIQYGNKPCILSIFTNIDTLKATQRALSEREANYRTILETAPYVITVTRLQDAKYIEVNDAFSRDLGYSREEVIGKTALELKIYKNESDREIMLEALRRDGRVFGIELEFRSKDGRIIESLFSTTPFTYQGEECLLSMTVDVSQRKSTERALRRSEQKYRNILMTMEEGYWEVDLNGNFTFVNEATCRIQRRAAKDLIGTNNLDYFSPETSKKVLQVFDTLYQTGLPAMLYDLELTRGDGSQAIIESSASLQKDETGTSVGIFGIARDITEKKKAADDLERYRQHLEEMVRERTQELESAQNELVKQEKFSMLGQLTATVSHELRNPLGVIRSSNYYLRRKIDSDDAKVNKHFQRIEDQVNLCALIVTDLLEYTHGRAVEREVQPITPWLEELIDQLMESENIAIEKHISRTLPSVPHDQEKLQLVFINLINNAAHAVREQAAVKAKAGEPYQPKVLVTGEYVDGKLVIEVGDNGVGMDEKMCRQAFEPLFTTRARGTGIGLANVQKIIFEHKGEVSLASEPGKGTTITIKMQAEIDKR